MKKPSNPIPREAEPGLKWFADFNFLLRLTTDVNEHDGLSLGVEEADALIKLLVMRRYCTAKKTKEI